MSEREYPSRPYAAVGVIIVSAGRVLITQRAKPPRRGLWSIPGGGIELGETLEEAAGREIAEELSIQVDLRGVVDAVDIIVRHEDGRVQYHYVIVDLLGLRPRGEIRPGSDVQSARWVRPEELLDYDLPERTLEVIHKALRAAEETRS